MIMSENEPNTAQTYKFNVEEKVYAVCAKHFVL